MRALKRLEYQLAQTPFLVGEEFSLADIACVAYTRLAHEGGFDLGAYPAVKRWIAACDRKIGLWDVRRRN